ncbi:hypothetical protein ACK3TF_004662 [Chlorella vulgaris]
MGTAASGGAGRNGCPAGPPSTSAICKQAVQSACSTYSRRRQQPAALHTGCMRRHIGCCQLGHTRSLLTRPTSGVNASIIRGRSPGCLQTLALDHIMFLLTCASRSMLIGTLLASVFATVAATITGVRSACFMSFVCLVVGLILGSMA